MTKSTMATLPKGCRLIAPTINYCKLDQMSLSYSSVLGMLAQASMLVTVRLMPESSNIRLQYVCRIKCETT